MDKHRNDKKLSQFEHKLQIYCVQQSKGKEIDLMYDQNSYPNDYQSHNNTKTAYISSKEYAINKELEKNE